MMQLNEIAQRIRELREIMGWSVDKAAGATEVSPSDYIAYESGETDLPFTFIHKCAIAFGVELTELLEGRNSARLSSYTVTRKGRGQETAKEEGIEIKNLAPKFRSKIAEPYWVRYEYSPALQNRPIHLTTHGGQEFDLVLSGKLKVQVGEHTEILEEGDSIYYNSSTPHGMIAIDGRDCVFCAVVLPGEEPKEETVSASIASARRTEGLLAEKFVKTEENADGSLKSVRFENTDSFNFGFDVVDAIAAAETNENDKPVEDITIESITFENYHAQ